MAMLPGSQNSSNCSKRTADSSLQQGERVREEVSSRKWQQTAPKNKRKGKRRERREEDEKHEEDEEEVEEGDEEEEEEDEEE